MQEQPPRKKSKIWYVLLLLPFIFTLFPSMYASATPAWGGFPFFYWYQFLWVAISAIITAIVYFATKE